MSAAILELEKNQMLPETELEQETVYVYRRQQGRGAGVCVCVWFRRNWKTGYCGQELILTFINHLPPTNPFWHTLSLPCSLNKLNVLVSYASFSEQTEPPLADDKGSIKHQLNGLVHITSSGRSWYRGTYLWFRRGCLNQRQDLVSASPSNQCHLPPVAPPCPLRPGHTGLFLLQHTTPFPASGPWSLLFPLLRILFLQFFSWHPPSTTRNTHAAGFPTKVLIYAYYTETQSYKWSYFPLCFDW